MKNKDRTNQTKNKINTTLSSTQEKIGKGLEYIVIGQGDMGSHCWKSSRKFVCPEIAPGPERSLTQE